MSGIYERARRLGALAFKAGKKRVPAHDPRMMTLIASGRGVSATASALLTQWLGGWDDANLKAPVPGWTPSENAALTSARGRDRSRTMRTALVQLSIDGRTTLPSGVVVQVLIDPTGKDVRGIVRVTYGPGLHEDHVAKSIQGVHLEETSKKVLRTLLMESI